MSSAYSDFHDGSGPSSLSCWVVSDGRAGMENQCLGLASALGLFPVVKRIALRTPWRQLSPYLRVGLSLAASEKGDPIAPPWPDILIASGRASVPASIYARAASRKEGGRGTFTIQIQNPVIAPSWFDLVVVPAHDRVTGANVLSTRGSLHRITPDLLESEARKFLPQVSGGAVPHTAVLIGGSNSVYSLTSRQMRQISGQLAILAKRHGPLMVTTSRRTGQENLTILQDALRDTGSYIWDGKGDNPYFGMLGLAETILVTCDSVNMISEACSTGKPVMIIELPGGSNKFRRFHRIMAEAGMTRPFRGRTEKWSYEPLDDMSLVVDRVRTMIEARL